MNKFTPDQISQARAVSIASLLDIEERGRYASTPCPMCGGRDRFQIKFEDNFWICRQCGDGKYQDVIALVMKRDNLPFTDAITSLLGTAAITPLPTPKPRQAKPIQNFIDEFRDQYEALPNNAAVLAYAVDRGLTHDTLKRFLCGSDGNVLTLPYFTEDKRSVPAVRKRYIRTNDKKCIFGSRFVIPFGLQALDGRDSLVIVEGEINAMSIAQSSDVDVLSFGSESIRTDGEQFTIICDVAKRYERVLIWCDKPEVSQRLGRAIPRADLRMSPNGNDANDLLQRGLLAQFMARILPSPTQTPPPQRGDILRTNDGRNITTRCRYDCGLIAATDEGETDAYNAKPYRIVAGVAHELVR